MQNFGLKISVLNIWGNIKI